MSLKLFIRDKTSPSRRQSKSDAVEFEPVERESEAQVIAIHISETGRFGPFAPEGKDQLLLLYQGGGPARPTGADVKSGRVMGLGFAVPRNQKIHRGTWRRVAAKIDHTDKGLRWSTPILEEARPDCLSALSILCQGFLATRGDEALEGWEELPTKVREQVTKQGNHPELLQAEWWLQPFKVEEENQDETVRRLLESVEEEWWTINSSEDLAEPIRDLVTAIEGGSLGRLEEGLAREAYLKIKEAFDDFYL